MHGNANKTKLESIFNKEIIFSSCLWKKVTEKIIMEIINKSNLEKKELQELQTEFSKLFELNETKTQECLKLNETLNFLEKSKVEFMNEEFMKFKEKVHFIFFFMATFEKKCFL